ncbi:MAG: cytochrome c-type biogenesis CcmF C-terminal domain-containing protein [Pseudomonadota bacterium]
MTGLAALCLAGALGVALLLLLVAQALGWKRRRIGMLARPWLLALLILLTIGLAGESGKGLRAMSPTGWIVTGSWLAVSLLSHLAGRGSRHEPARLWGSRLAHLGLVIALAGILMSSFFTSTVQRALAPGESLGFSSWTIQLHEVWPAAGNDWTGLAAELRLSGGDGVIVLKPEWQTPFVGPARSQPAKLSSGTGVLVASLGPRDAAGRWPISLSWTPLLVLIPIGLWIAALGCAVAMAGPSILRQRRLRNARLATAWWA